VIAVHACMQLSTCTDISNQNRRQKVFNRGVLWFCGGAWHKIHQNSNDLVFHVSIWGAWNFVWGG